MPLKVGVLSHCWPAKACQFPAVMCRAAMRRCCFKVCVCLSLHISGCFSSKDFPKEPECKTTPWVLCFWVSFFFWHKWRQNVWKPQTWQVPRSFRCRCHREMGLYLHLPWRSQDTNETSPTLSRLPAMIHTKLTVIAAEWLTAACDGATGESSSTQCESRIFYSSNFGQIVYQY